jgi:drug/metabolite transporter (DMT)-like permease
MFAIVFFYVLMAGVFTVGKQVVLYAHPFFISALRLPTAGFIFLMYARYSQKHKWYITRPIAMLIASYSIAIVFMDSGRFYALQTLPAANTALITSFAPFAAALASYLFLKEKISSRKIMILAIGFFGMLPLFISNMHMPADTNYSHLLFAYSSAFFSMIGFVFSGLFIKILTKRYNYSMFMAIGWGMLIGGAITFGLSLAFDPWNPMPFINASKAWPIIIYLFLTHNLIAYPLYGYLLEHYPLTLVVFAQLLTPLFTAILRLVAFGETISLPFMVSFAILSGSLYLFYKEEEKEGLIT